MLSAHFSLSRAAKTLYENQPSKKNSKVEPNQLHGGQLVTSLYVTAWIGRSSVACHFNRMREQISPDFFVKELPGTVFHGCISRDNRAMCTIGVALYVGTRD
jgi:hypothetical protein